MSRTRSVLIVEDEPLIAMMLEDFLESLGHQVVGIVDNAPAAIARVAAGGFDAAILDVHLRDGQPSWSVADAFADRGIPFVFATGGHVEPPPERHAGVALLAKPFSLDGCQRALENLG